VNSQLDPAAMILMLQLTEVLLGMHMQNRIENSLLLVVTDICRGMSSRQLLTMVVDLANWQL
jgi:hypothetical protein